MNIYIDFKLSEETQKEIQQEILKSAENILLKDKQELRKIINECVKGVIRGNITEILQSKEYKNYLRDEIMQQIGIKTENREQKGAITTNGESVNSGE